MARGAPVHVGERPSILTAARVEVSVNPEAISRAAFPTRRTLHAVRFTSATAARCAKMTALEVGGAVPSKKNASLRRNWSRVQTKTSYSEYDQDRQVPRYIQESHRFLLSCGLTMLFANFIFISFLADRVT